MVIDHRGSRTYFDNVEFVVGDAAQLKVVSMPTGADDAVHVTMHHAALGKDAVFRHFNVAGREIAQLTEGGCGSTRRVATPNCSACASPTTYQHLESRSTRPTELSVARHVQRVRCRGSVQRRPDTHTVWVGDVLIRAGATGTDTYEVNRNLVLTGSARADSVPNLEIETGEIRRRRPRQRDWALRRRATVLPAGRGITRTGPPRWCAASSAN